MLAGSRQWTCNEPLNSVYIIEVVKGTPYVRCSPPLEPFEPMLNTQDDLEAAGNPLWLWNVAATTRTQNKA